MNAATIPLAESLRPRAWEQFVNLPTIAPNELARWREGKGNPPSLLLWGPPGCGKTTFARLLGSSFDAQFEPFSAVHGGVKELREIFSRARENPKKTILFVDEIHRFSKTQQDALLPEVEAGVVTLLGATTENPSFALSQALLSRMRLVQFEPHTKESLSKIIGRVCETQKWTPSTELQALIIKASGGDGRKCIALSERWLEGEFEDSEKGRVEFFKGAKAVFYDRDDDEHYSVASAFIKSLRGSDPDAALAYGFRMLEAGEDPRFIFRRMIIFAAEDIGNADPRALMLAVSSAQAFEMVGLPEGKIPMAQLITYLASAPKSNRSYLAMHEVLDALESTPRLTVPNHLRNAPTKMMKNLGIGDGYQYPHDFDEGFAPGVKYLPKELEEREFYKPSEHGVEKAIKDKLNRIKSNR